MKTKSSTFSFHRRGRIWYAQFRIPETYKWSSARSTRTDDNLQALEIVVDWQKNGLPGKQGTGRRKLFEITTSKSAMEKVKEAPFSADEAEEVVKILESRGLVSVQPIKPKPGDIEFFSFIENFWNYDKSVYVKDRILHKKSITKKHCYDMTCRLKYWECFKGRMMSSITQLELKQLCVEIAEHELSDASINKTMLAGTAPLRWAKKNGFLDINPAEGLMRIDEVHEERGILTDTEAFALFSEGIWKSEMARVGNVLACTTGMRLGECLGLRRVCIGETELEVWNWTRMDGMKKPKNNEVRTVPILQEIRSELLALLATNPHGQGDDSFVFFGPEPTMPCSEDTLLDGLIGALESIGISDEMRKARNVDFHSWRHYFSTNLADRIDERKARIVTGHKSQSVFRKYADHKREQDVKDVAKAQKLVFKRIIEIERKKQLKTG
jgi:integrase